MEHTETDISQMVTDKIIAFLDAGIVPWQVSWGKAGLPVNALTGKPFKGVNIMLLAPLGFERNAFLSFDQIKELGGSVKKGEKSQVVIYRKWQSKTVSTLRYYHVFNIAQCSGLPEVALPLLTTHTDPIDQCHKIVMEMPNPPAFTDWDNDAYYTPKKDTINIPAIEYFLEAEAYYATLFPELLHSTGHSGRLNRKYLYAPTNALQHSYSIEKLIAEIGGWYLQCTAGISCNVVSDMPAYIQGWQAKLQNDKQAIIIAAGLAQKATEYILNSMPQAAPEVHREMAAV